MRRRAAALIVLTITLLASAACRRDDAAIVATFDVQQLPPAPPAPPPEPPAPLPADASQRLSSPPAPPNPADLLRTLNGRLAPVLFETNRWELSDDARKVIEEDAAVLREATNRVATVEGHADERGTEAWNEVLGIWRAKTVKDHLRGLGIDPSRMTIVSYGKTRPVATGDDPLSLARNRRVEIVLH
jgi:peptidoglycan-associated lipoprotein